MTPKDKNLITFIDLFAGIGGMRIAFESLGAQCLLTCEIDKNALITYKKNYKPTHNHIYAEDVINLQSKSIPKHDILIAGFPCQPYSIAGLRKGLKDNRGQVFIEIIRILRDLKPKAFLLENVKGILNHDNGETFKYMTEELNKIDYEIKVDILNSMTHANIPQNRERVFIVGMLDSTSLAKFIFPEKIKLKKTIHDCLDLKGDSIKPNHIYDERYDCFNIIKKSVLKTDTLYQWRRQYVRENKSNACPTLTANMGSGGHNVPLVLDPVLNKIRKLTPKETANFQGFPPTFKLPSELADSKLYHQFGKSVTVPLIKRIAKNIIDALK
jgi:DNA (cytosine-5)-methyltransferase 1